MEKIHRVEGITINSFNTMKELMVIPSLGYFIVWMIAHKNTHKTQLGVLGIFYDNLSFCCTYKINPEIAFPIIKIVST